MKMVQIVLIVAGLTEHRLTGKDVSVWIQEFFSIFYGSSNAVDNLAMLVIYNGIRGLSNNR